MAHYITATQDDDAYKGYPSLRRFFNKLWVHESCDTLGRYPAFPAGVDCPCTGIYAVRPVMNLSGMGAGSYIALLRKGECNKVPPGYFATPYTDADHYSVGYKYRHGRWQTWDVYHGAQEPIDIKRVLGGHKVPVPRFSLWERCTGRRTGCPADPPGVIRGLDGAQPHLPGHINVEYRGDLVVEIHLRPAHRIERSGDVLVPVYQSNRHIVRQRRYRDFVFEDLYDDADGFLPDPRLGFLVWQEPQVGEFAE